jgi:hypothetical protein
LVCPIDLIAIPLTHCFLRLSFERIFVDGFGPVLSVVLTVFTLGGWGMDAVGDLIDYPINDRIDASVAVLLLYVEAVRQVADAEVHLLLLPVVVGVLAIPHHRLAGIDEYLRL